MLHRGTLQEASYVEDCLWLSLEAMVKLLSSALTAGFGEQYSSLVKAVSQLAFEYGRYVLYAKEQALLDQYITNQYILDEQLQIRFDAFQKELCEQTEAFQHLIDEAFSPDLQDSLLKSTALARVAGVKEEELLNTVEDVDTFFLG